MQKPFLLTLEYPPQHGGIAKYLEGEVRSLSVPVVVSHVQEQRWMSLIWRERKKFQGCDGLWISHVLPMGYIALVWKWIYKTPYRVYLHGLDLVRPRQSTWKLFWVKIILQNADEIIVNSHATKKLLDYYKIDSRRDAKPCVSIQYPRIEQINTEQYKPIAAKLREKYNITDKPILLTVSRL
ncbi:MAG: glycosyltransferase, partial [Patescibacteria group bacterium]